MPTKAVAAGGTAAVAGAVCTLIFSAIGHPVAPGTEDAVNTLVTALLSGIATYWAPHNPNA